MPIFYFSELLSLALGAEPVTVEAWMKRHMNSPVGVLKKHNLL